MCRQRGEIAVCAANRKRPPIRHQRDPEATAQRAQQCATSPARRRRAVSFEAAIGAGYAPDGGLYVPEALPPITAEDLDRWRTLDFTAVAVEVLLPFLDGEVSRDELLELLSKSYAGYDAPETIPVTQLTKTSALVELFHGPTLCFKDLGLQVAVRLLALFARKRNEPRTLLVATTGDTGPAALRAVADVDDPSLRCVVCFPRGQISDLQRRQMTCASSEAIRVCCFEGGGDDMDAPIKRLSLDTTFKAQHGLTGVNSYNIIRPLAQQVHYVWLYLRCRELFSCTSLDVVVPTGAMGNLAAATFVKRRGVPLDKLCAATNVNDITFRAFSEGDFSRAPAMVKTRSDAINIQVPYNLKGCLLRVGRRLRADEAMDVFGETESLKLDDATRASFAETYRSARIDDAMTLAALRRCRETHGVTVDPHAAVALAGAAALGYDDGETPVAILATAHACKFEEAVVAAIGADAWREYRASPAFPARAAALEAAPETEPFALRRRAGESLEDAQRRWEVMIRALLEDPDGLHAVLGECVDEDDDTLSTASRKVTSTPGTPCRRTRC